MPAHEFEDRWLGLFQPLQTLAPEDLALARAYVRFLELDARDMAYRQGAECPNYLMCIEGGTRTFKTSSSGSEIPLYKVVPGSTCIFTTQCLLTGGTFPAESIAESPTRLAALPASAFHALMTQSVPFRRFVLDDYSHLLLTLSPPADT